MYAIRKSGVHGAYDLVDEINIEEYAESLPQFRESDVDVDEFKEYQAQYFTPSKLKSGLERARENIADVQGVLFDLDDVEDYRQLVINFYKVLLVAPLEAYLWKTPSNVFGGSHKNGARMFVPLAEAIHPDLLGQAVDELVIAFHKAGMHLINLGADLKSSRTIGRLMGLPIQKEGTIVPFDLEMRKRYRVKAQYVPKPKPTFTNSGVDLSDLSVGDLAGFIQNYNRKHGITWNRGERDDNLVRVIGAIKKTFGTPDEQDVLAAFYEAGVAEQLDNPEKDILNKTKRLLR